jgi:cysteine-rich repeat protein
VCDDGNRVSGDGCRADCRSAERCGDGVVDGANNEDCDCGTDPTSLPHGCLAVNSAASGATCRVDCTLARCGDGVLDPGELCDDGNNLPGDGCRADCAGRWTQMTSNSLDTLQSVFALDANHAVVCSDKTVLAWDGSTWSELGGPGGVPPVGCYAIRAITPDDVYVLLITGDVYHYNGITWALRKPSPAVSWLGIYARASDDVWLVGGTGSTPYVEHWTGSSWTALPTSGLANEAVYGVWISSAGDVYVVQKFGTTGGVFKYNSNSSSWNSLLSSPSGVAIDGSSTTDLVVLSADYVKYFDGATWTLAPNSQSLENASAAGSGLSVFGDEAVAVGSEGRILVRSAGAWQVSISPTSHNYIGAHQYAKGRAFVVGTSGTILY